MAIKKENCCLIINYSVFKNSGCIKITIVKLLILFAFCCIAVILIYAWLMSYIIWLGNVICDIIYHDIDVRCFIFMYGTPSCSPIKDSHRLTSFEKRNRPMGTDTPRKQNLPMQNRHSRWGTCPPQMSPLRESQTITQYTLWSYARTIWT